MGLLQSDNDLCQRLELSKVHELSEEEKVEYVEAQLQGIKQQLWRSRVDAILNHHLKTENNAEEIAVASKIEEHEANAKRYAEAIGLLEDLKSEL